MPRPKIVRLASAAGVAAAVILVVGAGWEVVGRQVGSWRTPSALIHGLYSRRSTRHCGAAVQEPEYRTRERLLRRGVKGRNHPGPRACSRAAGAVEHVLIHIQDQPRNLRYIGERLGANLIVEGSVLRAGRRLRIDAQLVHVASGAPVWAEQFDRELEDIFRIQDEISGAIVNKLRLTLGRDGAARTQMRTRTIRT